MNDPVTAEKDDLFDGSHRKKVEEEDGDDHDLLDDILDEDGYDGETEDKDGQDSEESGEAKDKGGTFVVQPTRNRRKSKSRDDDSSSSSSSGEDSDVVAANVKKRHALLHLQRNGFLPEPEKEDTTKAVAKVPLGPEDTWDFSLQALVKDFRSKCTWAESSFYDKFMEEEKKPEDEVGATGTSAQQGKKETKVLASATPSSEPSNSKDAKCVKNLPDRSPFMNFKRHCHGSKPPPPPKSSKIPETKTKGPADPRPSKVKVEPVKQTPKPESKVQENEKKDDQKNQEVRRHRPPPQSLWPPQVTRARARAPLQQGQQKKVEEQPEEVKVLENDNPRPTATANLPDSSTSQENQPERDAMKTSTDGNGDGDAVDGRRLPEGDPSYNASNNSSDEDEVYFTPLSSFTHKEDCSVGKLKTG